MASQMDLSPDTSSSSPPPPLLSSLTAIAQSTFNLPSTTSDHAYYSSFPDYKRLHDQVSKRIESIRGAIATASQGEGGEREWGGWKGRRSKRARSEVTKIAT